MVQISKYAIDVKEGDLQLFHTMFRTAMLEVDGADFDSLIEDEFVNKNIGFSLFLLHKFGIRKRSTEHYSKDFFNAYNPINIFEEHYEFYEWVEADEVRATYHQFFYELSVAYIVRTYGRMFNYWGLITIEEIADTMDYKIKATPAFYDLITVKQK